MHTFILHLRHLIQYQSGVGLVYLSLILIPLIGLAGLAIDSAYLVYLKARLQITADAAALASARNLPSHSTQLTSSQLNSLHNLAFDYGHLNMSSSHYGNVINPTDLVYGYWQTQDNSFMPMASFATGNEYINAVQVTASLLDSKGNAPKSHFAKLFDNSANQLSHTSIALAMGGTSGTVNNCLRQGLTALGVTEFGSNNNFLDGTCVHGEGGIKLGSNNCAADSGPAGAAGLSVPFPGGPLGSGGTDYGSDNAVKAHDECGSGSGNNDLLAHTQSKVLLDYLAPNTSFLFNTSIAAGDDAHSTAIRQAIDELITNGLPTAMNVFIDSGDITIESDLTNTVIVSGGTIDVPSNLSLNNVYLLADHKVEVGSNVNLGRIDFCSNPGPEQLLIIAAEEIKIGSNTNTIAAQLIAGKFIDYGSNEPVYGSSLLSAGDIKFGSNTRIHSCQGVNPVMNYAPPNSNAVTASKLVY